MRPAKILIILMLAVAVFDTGLLLHSSGRRSSIKEQAEIWNIVTSGLGLSDLCVATEARYTRHPAVSDFIAPFMDYPGAIEHFPTGSFWGPPGQVQ